MSAIFSRIRGRLRMVRGRCPACASEAPEGCDVCLGHQGPFPVEPAQLQRWAYRFASRARAGRTTAVPAWRPVPGALGRAA